MKKFILLTLLLLFVLKGKAQHIHFSQYYINNQALNPALTGINAARQLLLQYRKQWHNLGAGYNSYALSYEQELDKKNIALGISLMSNKQALGIIKTHNVKLSYAYRLLKRRTVKIMFGIQPIINIKETDKNKIITAGMIDINTGKKTVSNNNYYFENQKHIDLSTGAAFFIKKTYFGFNVRYDNLVSFQNNNIPSELAFTGHFGTTIEINSKGLLHEEFYLQPNAIFRYQGGNTQLRYGCHLRYKSLTGGFLLSNDLTFNLNALIFLIGINNKRNRIAYSYDFTISELMQQGIFGAHELSVKFQFRKGKLFEKSRAIPCPDI